jgi:hypothetical protein
MPFATLTVAQEILPINLTALLAVFMGVSVIEQKVESIESSVQRLAETAEFDQQLAAPLQGPARIFGPSSDE